MLLLSLVTESAPMWHLTGTFSPTKDISRSIFLFHFYYFSLSSNSFMSDCYVARKSFLELNFNKYSRVGMDSCKKTTVNEWENNIFQKFHYEHVLLISLGRIKAHVWERLAYTRIVGDEISQLYIKDTWHNSHNSFFICIHNKAEKERAFLISTACALCICMEDGKSLLWKPRHTDIFIRR